jgi:hypothetical protein
MEGRDDPPELRGITPNTFQYIFDTIAQNSRRRPAGLQLQLQLATCVLDRSRSAPSCRLGMGGPSS